MSIKINPHNIRGPWRDGYALDVHTTSRTMIGHNAFVKRRRVRLDAIVLVLGTRVSRRTMVRLQCLLFPVRAHISIC